MAGAPRVTEVERVTEKTPSTDEEIAEDMISKLTAEELLFWRALKGEELGMQHWGWAMRIRNEYRLWDPENARYLLDEPDSRSADIVEIIWKLVHKRHPPLPPQQRAAARRENGLDRFN